MEKDQNYSSYQFGQEIPPGIKKSDDDEISLKEVILKIKELWKYLLSKWKIILIVGVIGGGLGLVYSYYKKPVYTAELSFALEEDEIGSGFGAALGLASQLGWDLGGGGGGGAFAGDNLLELMKSRSIVEKTLLSVVDVDGRKQTLAEYYIEYNTIRKGWQKNPGFQDIQFLPGVDRSKFSLQQDSLLGGFYGSIIENNLVVDKVDKNLSIISVKVASENELFSKFFTELLVKNVSDFYVQTKTKKSSQNLRLLQHQTDSVRRELNAAISGVAVSSDVNPNPNPSRQVLRVPSQRRQVDVQANQAILTELVKNLELAKISLRRETPLIQVIDKPILPLKKEKIGKIKAGIVGFCIMSFITIIFLVARKVYDGLMINN